VIPAAEIETSASEAAYGLALGQRLRQARTRSGLSLRGVARVSQGRIKAPALGAWERGDRGVSAEKLAVLADFYDVDGGWLLGGGCSLPDLVIGLKSAP
jgi:transcriptional regulator with XRE-family HTH domain